MPTIDERIEALVHSLELFQAELAEERRRREDLEAREKRGRVALLRGITAYLEALDGEA